MSIPKSKELVICDNCGIGFIDYKKNNRKFCSNSCKLFYRNKYDPELRYSAITKDDFIATPKLIDYIDGLLLGDGCIGKVKTERRTPRYKQCFSRLYRE